MLKISPYFIIMVPIIVGVIIQAIKFVLYSLKHGWDWHYILTHGHMPSAHTAFAVSLLISIGHYEGVHSGAFAVAFALAFLIIDDAARLRMYMGDQGRYLNMLVSQLHVDASQFPRLKERMGHRISEVIVGGILGFLLTIVLINILG